MNEKVYRCDVFMGANAFPVISVGVKKVEMNHNSTMARITDFDGNTIEVSTQNVILYHKKEKDNE